MSRYAIAFDLAVAEMSANGLTQSQITQVYQKEIPNAFRAAGFDGHLQGSVYHTETEREELSILINLKTVLQAQAPTFCRYASRIHVFRLEAWSDVTSDLSTRPVVPVEKPALNEMINELFNQINS